MAELKEDFAKECDAHDRLRIAVNPLVVQFGVGPINSTDDLIRAVEFVPQRVENVVDASLHYDLRQTMAIARFHYEDIDLAAISRGFSQGYTDEELNEMEQEVTLRAEALAAVMKTDDEYPFKPE